LNYDYTLGDVKRNLLLLLHEGGGEKGFQV
jgi:hypothetical protein